MLCTLTAMAQQTARKLVNAEPDKRNQKVINRYNQCHKSPDLYTDSPFETFKVNSISTG